MITAAEFRVLSPTAILGYGFPEESFMTGMERNPHLIAVDAGSTDPGPYYLGKGKSFTSRAFVKSDLTYMIREGVKRGIPVVIGTAGGSGARPHVDWCREIIEEIAAEENLSFKLGIIYADIAADIVTRALEEGRISPLPFVHDLTAEIIKSSVNIVAQMGMEPITAAHKEKCDVILCGRCYDPAVFAALPVMKGFSPGLAMHMGKILECAAIAATPGSGSDCVMGTLTEKSFILEPLSGERKFTKESTAAHTLYEKSDPYHLPGPGGIINLEACSFKELPVGKVEVTGSRFEAASPYRIKLEAAMLTGYRCVSIAGTRDPVMIKGISSILDEVKDRVYSLTARENIKGDIHFHVYGKDGVMKAMEPLKKTASHELCIVIEAIGPAQEDADMVCSITRSTLLHYGYKGRISTAGNLAFPFSPSDMSTGEVYEFSMYHLMEIEDQNIFKTEIINIPGGKA